MSQIRVMLVDDSAFFLSTLQNAIEKDPTLQVVSKAMNGEDALKAVPSIKPDVILCDIQMPKMSGLEFLQKLLPQYPVPVVVISGTPGVTLTALSSGAVDFISKPSAQTPKPDFFAQVISTIKTASQANIRAKTALSPSARVAMLTPVNTPVFTGAPSDIIVAIGASTGGTDAILEVIRNLPVNFPPVVIAQHMPPKFTTMYAKRLDAECHIQVSEAKDGTRVFRGQAILAAGENHLTLNHDSKGYFVSSRSGEKVNGHVPSVEVLFKSVAKIAGKNSIGVILTGMGGDGAEGLLEMRKAGAYTIGQDKETSVVYGMPMVAFNKGAVAKQLPLDKIAGELIRHLNNIRK